MTFYPKLAETIDHLEIANIPSKRKTVLQQLIDYIDKKLVNGKIPMLNFICSHNSRRSQLAQVWAQTAASYYNVNVECYSGGEVVTEFNKNAVETLRNSGFGITKEGLLNPKYLVHNATGGKPIICFSKLYNDESNPGTDFGAIMTCAEADRNCPVILEADQRIPLLYDDPREFDDTPEMAEKYVERSSQIATEMFFVFSEVRPVLASN